MSDTVEHKTYKQALLEFYQAKGIPSSDIKLEVKVEGSPHCPKFRCTVKIPRVPSTQFAGYSLSAEGKSKKAAEHAAAAAALNHLRDVGLLKVPAPAARACTARAAPPPQAPQPPHYRMGDMGFATHPQSYGAGGTNPWASPDSRYTGGAPPLRTRSPALQPDARSYGKQFPSGVEPVEVSKEVPSSSAFATPSSSLSPSRASSVASGHRGSETAVAASEPTAVQSALARSPSRRLLTLEDVLKGGPAQRYCQNPRKLTEDEAKEHLEAANEIIQQLHALLLEERQRRKLEVQEEKERRKFAAEVLLGIKAGNRTFLESDAMKALENKMGHLRLPTS
jgi:hypothetical protein